MTKFRLLALTLPIVLVACASSKPPERRSSEPPQAMKDRRAMGPITAMGSAGLLIASFNRNDNYSIDQDEFTRGRDKAFEIADNNNDGQLSPFEMETWRTNALGSVDASPGNMYFDPDFNQLVSKQEFNVALGKIFQTSDKDGNGIISFDELVKIVERPTAPQGRTSRASGGRPKGGGGRGGGGRRQ